MSSTMGRLQALFKGSSKTNNLIKRVRKFKKASEYDLFRKSNQAKYETMVTRLAAAQRFSDIEDILEHQKKYQDIRKEGFACRLIALYGKAGMFGHAQKLFDEMPQLNCQRTVKSFNALLSACTNTKKPDKVTEIFTEIPKKLSIKPDNISYNIVIKALCEVGSFDSALSVVDEMEKNGLKPNTVTFNTLLDALYRNDKFSDAEKLWGLMENKDVVPNVRSYNPKLRALVADNRISEAVDVIEEMRSKGIMPDVFSFNALIKGFHDSGNMEQAKRWFTKMTENGCTPDSATLSMLGYLACDKGDFEYALEVCKEAIRLRRLVNPKMLQLVVDGLVKESKKEVAMELVTLGKSNDHFQYKLKIPSDV
ncbi:hypothetical protein NMG60_11012539 [Bertholletia excelsa]